VTDLVAALHELQRWNGEPLSTPEELDDLRDALNGYSPRDAYFGEHPDYRDYPGFWPHYSPARED
jgi:hypothetical protein